MSKPKTQQEKNPKRLCLDIGCGNKPSKSTETEKWINLDKMYYEGVDYMRDCTRGLPFNKNTFDYVLMSHVIEHLSGKEIEHTLEEIYRVCKHGALIKITTPHWTHPTSWGDFFHKQHLSEYVWEHLQVKIVVFPKTIKGGVKTFIRWQFNIKELKVKDGEVLCIYEVNKSDKYEPSRVGFPK